MCIPGPVTGGHLGQPEPSPGTTQECVQQQAGQAAAAPGCQSNSLSSWAERADLGSAGVLGVPSWEVRGENTSRSPGLDTLHRLA